MNLIRKCPFAQPDMICVCGHRYQPIDVEFAERRLPHDLPGLLWTGECTCCVKATGQG